MYILSLAGHEGEGAYAVTNDDGHKALYLFQQEDDATRYAGLLEAEESTVLTVVENTAVNDTEVDLDGEKVEDTLTLLNKYIEDSDFELKKDRVKTLLKEVYLEACESE